MSDALRKYASEHLRQDVEEMLDDPFDTTMEDIVRLRMVAAELGEDFDALLKCGTPFEQARFKELLERWKR